MDWSDEVGWGKEKCQIGCELIKKNIEADTWAKHFKDKCKGQELNFEVSRHQGFVDHGRELANTEQNPIATEQQFWCWLN